MSAILHRVTVSLAMVCLLGGNAPLPAATAPRRPITLDDMAALREVGDPRLSPEGEWVAYTVRSIDVKKDRRDTDIWMASWDGARNLRLTSSPKSEHTPRWSPDGRYLAFLSSRDVEEETDQIWLLDRAGGEAVRVTELKGGISDFVWSPDGRMMAVIASDPDPDAPKKKGSDDEEPAPKPIVIDRYAFKLDEEGYLGKQREHLYLFDVAARKPVLLTPGEHDEALPSWSPDGRSIAFVTKRGGDPDRHNNFDVYVIDAREGAQARRLTTFDGADSDPYWDSRPVWSPDGRSIACVQGGPDKLTYYAGYQIAVVPAGGGPARLPVRGLDRNTWRPQWAADGTAIWFQLEDDQATHLARVGAGGGAPERVVAGRREVMSFDAGARGRVAVLMSSPHQPPEVFAFDGSGEPRPLSRQNDAVMASLQLSAVEEISFRSRDRTEIHGFIVKPLDWKPDTRYPAILRIHGGPVAQFTNEFVFEHQILAAGGYLVVAANPRGSSGRGQDFAMAIYADWGNKDAQDVLAAVDHAVARGLADPGRLGVGGWSYGGMLTNYVIARDDRFKAAASGSSISNILAGYGTDQYIREYEMELGPPWKSLDVWLRVSFPFLKADRIRTPTLFLCGDRDFNVPLLASEQMYQALRSLGVDTQLVIYPEQHHGLTRPSYLRDRLERYLSWFGRYLEPAATPAAPAPGGAMTGR